MTHTTQMGRTTTARARRCAHVHRVGLTALKRVARRSDRRAVAIELALVADGRSDADTANLYRAPRSRVATEWEVI